MQPVPLGAMGELLRRRPWRRARLSQSARADRPVVHRAGGPSPLPHRRPRAHQRRGRAGVLRPHRQPSEDPGLSRRAGGDRGRAAGAARDRQRGRAPLRARGHALACRLRGAGRSVGSLDRGRVLEVFRAACQPTWCPPRSTSSTPCRCWRAAKSIARVCPSPLRRWWPRRTLRGAPESPLEGAIAAAWAEALQAAQGRRRAGLLPRSRRPFAAGGATGGAAAHTR